MEDFIGWLIIVIAILSVSFAIYFIVARRAQRKMLDDNMQTYNDLKTKIRSVRPVPPPPPPAKVRTPAVAETKSQQQSQTATDWSPDILTTMIIADMLTHNKSSSSGTVTWENDKPTIHPVPASSFGFDDSESRKTISSSFSSDYSSSSSFSSDSSSSSSDSGPSSDW